FFKFPFVAASTRSSIGPPKHAFGGTRIKSSVTAHERLTFGKSIRFMLIAFPPCDTRPHGADRARQIKPLRRCELLNCLRDHDILLVNLKLRGFYHWIFTGHRISHHEQPFRNLSYDSPAPAGDHQAAAAGSSSEAPRPPTNF